MQVEEESSEESSEDEVCASRFMFITFAKSRYSSKNSTRQARLSCSSLAEG